MSENHVCTICGKVVEDFAPRYTITGNHYQCEFPEGRKTTGEMIAELDQKFGRLVGKPKKKRAAEGTGPTARKAQALAVAAIEKVLDADVYDVLIWNQKGAYRGPRWDLDVWGLYFSFKDSSGLVSRGQASALATMSSIIKAKFVYVVKGKEYASFEIYGTDDPAEAAKYLPQQPAKA